MSTTSDFDSLVVMQWLKARQFIPISRVYVFPWSTPNCSRCFRLVRDSMYVNAYPSDEQVVSNKQVVAGEWANLRCSNCLKMLQKWKLCSSLSPHIIIKLKKKNYTVQLLAVRYGWRPSIPCRLVCTFQQQNTSKALSVIKDSLYWCLKGKKAKPHMPSSLWTAHNTGGESG